MIVYFNGAIITEDSAHIALNDRGLMLGDGVFDTMLAIDGQPVDGTAHAERLARHAAVMGIPFDGAGLPENTVELLCRNQFTSGRHAIRTTVTRGPGARGLLPPEQPSVTVIMRAAPVPAPSLPPAMITAHGVRRNEGSPLSRIKSLNYGDNIMALMEAKRAGTDDAVILNNAGNAACASASNIYVLCNGQWLTPRLEDGAMDGIGRAQLLAQGRTREDVVDGDQLSQCTALAIGNSLMGLRAATMLDGRALALLLP